MYQNKLYIVNMYLYHRSLESTTYKYLKDVSSVWLGNHIIQSFREQIKLLA
jgi:hypothetical protein